MTQGWLDFLAPLAGLFCNSLAHIVSFRFISRGRMLVSLVAGFFFGLFCFLLFSIGYTFEFPVLAQNFLTYIFLSYGYFHFVNLGETARRIRLLRELMDSEGGLTLDQIGSRYNAQEILSRRLERLVKNGQVVLKDGRCFIAKPTVLFIAKMMLFLKHLLLERGGSA
ncbi:MAG: hypothetical protein HZB36_01530 [Candidatus Omnitrophica bacterium]|nr:hypothetical protein [Candidatus Omnitrophota bacterium]